MIRPDHRGVPSAGAPHFCLSKTKSRKHPRCRLLVGHGRLMNLDYKVVEHVEQFMVIAGSGAVQPDHVAAPATCPAGSESTSWGSRPGYSGGRSRSRVVGRLVTQVGVGAACQVGHPSL
jgi:hypothetical protein